VGGFTGGLVVPQFQGSHDGGSLAFAEGRRERCRRVLKGS
jgi:hypothetical protein